MARLQFIADYLGSVTFQDEETRVLDLNVLFGQVSPPYTEVIPMQGEIRSSALLDAFVMNVMHSGIELSITTWKRLINLCAGDHQSLRLRIVFQLLFIMSKADVDEFRRVMQKEYSAALETLVIPSLCNLQVTQLEAAAADADRAVLLKPIILAAFRKVLVQVFGEDDAFSVADIANVIAGMAIFTADSLDFPIRGAVLRSGVFLNLGRLCRLYDDLLAPLNDADRITLLCHESMHYIVRRQTNNYNFSSPFSGASSTRFDPSVEQKHLECGRLLELTLFGNQPDWRASTFPVAKEFMHQLDVASELPLPNIGFTVRSTPSLSFGIDYEIDEFVLE